MSLTKAVSKVRLGVFVVFAVFGSMLIGATAPHASATTCSETFGGGAGTEEAPYLISTVPHLQELSDTANSACFSAYFLQSADLVLTGIWSPVGPAGTAFTGVYDGNGFTISGLHLAAASNQGLFGQTTGAIISDLTVLGAEPTTEAPFTGHNNVGTLVGLAVGTQVSNVQIRTTLNVDGNGSADGLYVGGMVGWAEDTEITSSVILAGSVVEGALGVGGFVGNMVRGSVSNSVSHAEVHAHSTSPSTVGVAGGLVGWSEGPATVTASESYGDVSAWNGTSPTDTSGDYIAGAVGIQMGNTTLTDVVAHGDVIGKSRIGGIVGFLGDSTLTDSSSFGFVRGVQYVGGAIGSSTNSTIENSTAQGSTTCLSGSYAGGFIGLASTETAVLNSGATGSVSTTVSCDKVGGFAGQVDGNAFLEGAYATGVVTGTRFVGGLVGLLVNANVSNAYATGAVSGTDRVGGLIGIASSEVVIAQTRAAGDVSGTEFVGGVVGVLGNSEDAPTPGSNVRLSESFATGDVSSTHQYAGGIAGVTIFDAFISDSYATGAVSGSAYVGSTIGRVWGAEGGILIRNVYGIGSLSASSAPANIGGVLGGTEIPADERVVSTYWDPASTGVTYGIGDATNGTDADGISALTPTQMRSSVNFAAWNFSTVWGYQCGVSTTPQLRWHNPLATATSAGPCPSPAPSPSNGSAPLTSEPEPPTVTASQPGTQAPGTVGFMIDGQVIPVRVETGPRGTGLMLQAGPVEFTLRGQTASGQRVPIAPDGSLILPRTGVVPISGDGLEPNSSVAITLFSDPIALGSSGVSGDGTFTASPTIPSTVPLGAHTLQLTGRTKTGDPFILSIGVLVETPAAALGANPVITVRPKIVTPGASVSVTAQGVQAGCRVTFTLAGKRANATASKKGVAQVQITMPEKLPRTVSLRASVTGPKCSAVAVSERVPAARSSAR